MQKHLILTTALEFEEIISGKVTHLVRFFKKRQDFLNLFSGDDLVFLRKGKEVLGQFRVGKIILIENFDSLDFKILEECLGEFDEGIFEANLGENSIMVIMQIKQLEQLITSPVDVPKGTKKEWVVLDNN